MHRAAARRPLMVLLAAVPFASLTACGSSDNTNMATASRPRTAAAQSVPASDKAPTAAAQRRYGRKVSALVRRLEHTNRRAWNSIDSLPEAARRCDQIARNFREAALAMGDIKAPAEVQADHEVLAQYFWTASRSLKLSATAEAARAGDLKDAKRYWRLPLVHPGMARQLVKAADHYEETGYRIRHLTDLGPKDDAAGSEAPDEEQVS